MAKRGRPAIPQEHLDAVVRLVRDDRLPVSDAARAVGVSVTVAHRATAAAGVHSSYSYGSRELVMELGRAGLRSTRVARAAGVSDQRVRQIWAEEDLGHRDLVVEVDGEVIGACAIGLGALRRALARAAKDRARKEEPAADMLGVGVDELRSFVEIPEVCRAR